MKSSYPLGNWEGKRVRRSVSQETCLEKEESQLRREVWKVHHIIISKITLSDEFNT